MHTRLFRPILLLALTTLVAGACAPTAPSGTPSAGGPARQVPSGQDRRPTPTLITVVRVEPTSLASKPVTATGAGVNFIVRVFNAELDTVDAQDRPVPYLAEALPQLNTDSWRVFPDGRMETTWRLRPNLTWHDGVALTAEDFVFAHQVYTRPEYGVSGSKVVGLMEEIQAPDARTVVIRWKAPFPDAFSLKKDFQPLPRHLLDLAFRQDNPEAFANLPYWGNQYVGLGPYKLDKWEPGAFVEGVAFDGHAWGRPKIDRIQIKFIADENVAMANLLSESVHLATDRSIRFEHTQVMKQEWGASNRGTVLLTPSLIRYLLGQFRPETVAPRAWLDLRVRRAIAHAVDKAALNEGVFEGQATTTDTFVSPDVPYFAELDRALTKYPYDVRRSEQLMADAGYTKDRDGFFASANGERFQPHFWEESGSQNEKELNVFLNTWRRAGFDFQTFVLPAVQLRDAQLRSTYPMMYTTQGGGSTEDRLDTFATLAIPTAANRYQGNNRGGWANNEYDRLWEQFNTTLERSERNRQVIQMLRLVSEDVPAIPIYFNMAPTAHLATLTGPQLGARVPDPLVSWNIHEWEWKQ